MWQVGTSMIIALASVTVFTSAVWSASSRSSSRRRSGQGPLRHLLYRVEKAADLA